MAECPLRGHPTCSSKIPPTGVQKISSIYSEQSCIFSWDNNSFQTSEGLQAATRNNMDSTNFIEEIEAQFILRVLVKYWPEGILSHFHTAWAKFCTVILSKYHIRGSIMLQFNM